MVVDSEDEAARAPLNITILLSSGGGEAKDREVAVLVVVVGAEISPKITDWLDDIQNTFNFRTI